MKPATSLSPKKGEGFRKDEEACRRKHEIMLRESINNVNKEGGKKFRAGESGTLTEGG